MAVSVLTYEDNKLAVKCNGGKHNLIHWHRIKRLERS
jgi:hypothetical protein